MKKLLKRLVIESATKYLYVSLLKGEDTLGFYYEEGDNDHSVKLMSEIERILLENKMKVKDLDEIIIGVGPGSYTGLRIGVTVAKMFGWNSKIPVKTISSLALLASSYNGEKDILAEVDARRGNSFLGVYKNTGNSLEMVVNEQLTNLDSFIDNYENDLEIVSQGQANIVKIINSNLLLPCEDIHNLAPNYLRITEAERNKR